MANATPYQNGGNPFSATSGNSSASTKYWSSAQTVRPYARPPRTTRQTPDARSTNAKSIPSSPVNTMTTASPTMNGSHANSRMLATPARPITMVANTRGGAYHGRFRTNCDMSMAATPMTRPAATP